MANPADREKILNKILKACNIKLKKSKNPKRRNKVWRPEDLDGYYFLAAHVNDSNLRLVNEDDLTTSTYMYSLYMFELVCDYLSLRHISKKDYEFTGGVLTLFSDIQVSWEAEYHPLLNCYRLFHAFNTKLLQIWSHGGPPFEFYESMNWPQDPKSTVFYSAGMSALEAMNKFSYSIHRLSFDSRMQLKRFNKKEKPEQSMGDFANEWWHFFKTLLNKELPPQVWPESIIKREIDSTKTQVGYEYTQATKASSKIKKPKEKQLYVLKKITKDVWQCRYEDEEKPVTHCVGLSYTSYLLNHPNENISAIKLKTDVSSSPNQIDRTEYTPDDTMDLEYLEKCSKTMKQLNGDLDQAQRNNDLAEIERITNEIQKIRETLSSSQGLGGRIRKFSDHKEKHRTSITQAIDRARNSIKKECPKLYKHLKNSIHTGEVFSYTPERQIPWIL